MPLHSVGLGIKRFSTSVKKKKKRCFWADSQSDLFTFLFFFFFKWLRTVHCSRTETFTSESITWEKIYNNEARLAQSTVAEARTTAYSAKPTQVAYTTRHTDLTNCCWLAFHSPNDHMSEEEKLPCLLFIHGGDSWVCSRRSFLPEQTWHTGSWDCVRAPVMCTDTRREGRGSGLNQSDLFGPLASSLSLKNWWEIGEVWGEVTM